METLLSVIRPEKSASRAAKKPFSFDPCEKCYSGVFSLLRRLLQSGIDLAEIAVGAVGVDGDLHDAIPEAADRAWQEYNDPRAKVHLFSERKGKCHAG
ncbi:MAG TPA: hypothetical protein VMF69_04925 [Gemmataceae bacterium]|nr:hypothetical protein [Gemmataceae bacterium]